MILIFHKEVKPDNQTVYSTISTNEGPEVVKIGEITFKSKTSWAKFMTALQNGALGISDLAISVENVPMKRKED